jgi:hypothetical protein
MIPERAAPPRTLVLPENPVPDVPTNGRKVTGAALVVVSVPDVFRVLISPRIIAKVVEPDWLISSLLRRTLEPRDPAAAV